MGPRGVAAIAEVLRLAPRLLVLAGAVFWIASMLVRSLAGVMLLLALKFMLLPPRAASSPI